MTKGQLIASKHGITVEDEYALALTVDRPANINDILIQLSETGEANAVLYKITGTNEEGKKEITLFEDVPLAAAEAEITGGTVSNMRCRIIYAQQK